ncbi:MAG: lipopolysaccharide transport periplasmic protein LptA [Deltaproteobacteria bacterium]|nr:lipopolysaccharide transport periplasmic protein LptA [Deltaproteobacteria bacterium]
MIHKKRLLAAVVASFIIGVAVPGGSFAKDDSGMEAPKKPINVTSDKMEADKNASVVVFKGNVVAVEDFTLCSDELYVYYDDKKEVKDIVANGNVRIFQQDKTATAGKAAYDRKNRSIVLTEDPQVVQCADTVKGDKITVFMDEDRAIVESGGGGRVRALIMPEKKCTEAGKTVGGAPSEETRCKRPR